MESGPASRIQRRRDVVVLDKESEERLFLDEPIPETGHVIVIGSKAVVEYGDISGGIQRSFRAHSAKPDFCISAARWVTFLPVSIE